MVKKNNGKKNNGKKNNGKKNNNGNNMNKYVLYLIIGIFILYIIFKLSSYIFDKKTKEGFAVGEYPKFKENLILHIPFKDGTANDFSGNDNHGTFVGFNKLSKREYSSGIGNVDNFPGTGYSKTVLFKEDTISDYIKFDNLNINNEIKGIRTISLLFNSAKKKDTGASNGEVGLLLLDA